MTSRAPYDVDNVCCRDRLTVGADVSIHCTSELVAAVSSAGDGDAVNADDVEEEPDVVDCTDDAPQTT